jgi:hypothetical protein
MLMAIDPEMGFLGVLAADAGLVAGLVEGAVSVFDDVSTMGDCSAGRFAAPPVVDGVSVFGAC